MTAKPARAISVFDEFPKQVEKARLQAEKLAQRTWKQALELLPARPRKAVKDATARFEKVSVDFQKRSEKAMKQMNDRGKRLVSTFEQNAVRAVKPIVSRLDVASRTDVDKLSKRITQLERKVQQKRPVAV